MGDDLGEVLERRLRTNIREPCELKYEFSGNPLQGEIMSISFASQEKSKPSPTTGRVAFLAIVMLMMALPMGCSSSNTWSRNNLTDALVVSYRDMVWAKRAFNLRYGNCDRPYADHFENGFCAGYSEVCGGGQGHVPALPPENYRGYEFQTADGAKCINAWFEGYPEGVAAARKDNAGTFHDVLVSRMLEKAIKHQEASDAIQKQVPFGKEIPIVQGGSVGASNLNQATPIVPQVQGFSTRMRMTPSTSLPPIIMGGGASSTPPIVQADFATGGSNTPLPAGTSTSRPIAARSAA